MLDEFYDFKTILLMIEKNDLDGLDKAIKESKLNPNLVDDDNTSPLHLSVDLGNESITKLLIKNGFDVNCMTLTYGFTPLHIATKNKQANIVEYLLENGADINIRNNLDYSPLHLAVSSGSIEMVKLLLDHGADPNVITKDRRQETPLIKSCTLNLDLVELLMQYGAKINRECRELDVSILANKPIITKYLLRRIDSSVRLKPNKIGRTPLQNFVANIRNIDKNEAISIMDNLIKLGDDINYSNHFGSLFHILINRYASARRNDAIAVALFDHLLLIPHRKCDQDNDHGTPLSFAFKLNVSLFATKLIKEGFADVTKCDLQSFRFSSAFILPLKFLYYSGYKFSENFDVNNKPQIIASDISTFDKEVVIFERFCEWLENKRQEVLSLQCLIRIYIRNVYKEKTFKIVKTNEIPDTIKSFLLMDDIDDTLNGN